MYNCWLGRRSATFAASHAGAGGATGAAHVSLPAAAHGPPPQPAPQHSKRDQHHHSTAKKKVCISTITHFTTNISALLILLYKWIQ